jgi:solute carrier family 25 S-adenosylmethionine transporter 26
MAEDGTLSVDDFEHKISSASSPSAPPPFLLSLVAGGLAGTTVDVALFPIDTVKTRLQAPQGFLKAGGFRGIYNGLGAAAAGSAPGAALFFSSYESMKPVIRSAQQEYNLLQEHESVSHMLAASIGEAAACLVRVPTEVIKAKMQTESSASLLQTTRLVFQETHGSVLSGLFGGLYRGYGMTLFREIPFAMIQFPLYEKGKVWWGDYQQSPATPVQAAVCGSVSGGIAAAFTTPLDVLKTRLMLGVDKQGVQYSNAMDVLRRTVHEEGASALLHGLQPRVMWISIGGFVFFGAYESFKSILLPVIG